MAVGKELTQFSGSVEYHMIYRNPFLTGHTPDDEHHEYESFTTLSELLRLLEPDMLSIMKNTHGADRVEIAAIHFQGRNEVGDGAFLDLSRDKWSGWSKAKVTAEDFDSKMYRCVKELEKDMQKMQSTIQRYQI